MRNDGTVPLLGASFLQLLYNTADTIIVGRFVGKTALTAVGGSAGQIYAMVTEFMIGVSGGAGVILSQAYGAKNEKLLDDGLHNAVALALVLGTVFMTAGLIVSGPVLRLAGAPQETMKESVLYLRIVLCGLISNALYNMGASALRAVGDSKRPFRFLLFCSVLNIALDLLLVAGLGLGIGGAALATILSQTLSALLVLRTLIRGTGRELMPCLNPRRLRLQRDMALKMLRLGLPLGFETLMYTFSCVVLTSAVNTFGTDTVAAYAGFVRIESFYWMLEVALSVSITTFAGQNLGAGRMDRVHRVVREGAVLMYLLMGMTIVIMYTGCPVWLGLFTTDAGVISIGVDMMRYLLPFYILYVPNGRVAAPHTDHLLRRLRPEDPVGGIRVPASFFHKGLAVLLPGLLDRHIGHICFLLCLVYEKEGKTERAEAIKHDFTIICTKISNIFFCFFTNTFIIKGRYLVIGN